jgi:hypothetical protein
MSCPVVAANNVYEEKDQLPFRKCASVSCLQVQHGRSGFKEWQLVEEVQNIEH